MEAAKNGNGTQHEQPSTQLAVYQPSASLQAYEPRDISQARQLAQWYAASKLVPNVAGADQALFLMARGAEMGISATLALSVLYIVNGKVGMLAQYKLARAKGAKDIVKFIHFTESTDASATCEALRVGDEKPERVTFTIEDAKRAGLVKTDSNWTKWPRRMLRWRAAGELIDFLFPEVSLGIPNAEDLADEFSGSIPMPSASPVVLDAEEVKPSEPAPPPNFDALFATWESDLKLAITIKDCEAVASEMQARLPGDSEEIKRGAAMVKTRKAEIRGGGKSNPDDVIK